MNGRSGLSELEDLPLSLRLLWDRSVKARRHSGLNAFRGFYYQYLYSLPLIAELLENKTYDAFACECIEDFLLWRSNPAGSIDKVMLIQVKSSVGRCFIRNEVETQKVLESFVKAAEIVTSETNAELRFRLVYNRHHDCEEKNCFDLFRTYPAYRTLTTEISSLIPAANVEELIEFKPFLPIPITRESFMKELNFLEKIQPGILNFLGAEGSLGKFVRSLFAIIAPFYNSFKRSPSGESSSNSEPLLWGLHRDQIHAVNDLRGALAEAMEHARSKSSHTRLAEAFKLARRKANIELQVAGNFTPDQGNNVSVTFGSPDAAVSALSSMYLLDWADSTVLFNVNGHEISQESQRFRLSSPVGGKVPINKFLQRQGHTHRARVQLILSFIKAILVWSQKGLVLTEFRADNREHRDLYFVQPGEGGGCFVLGDIEMLVPSDETSGLFDSKWLSGEMLAKALRFLYYGKTTDGAIKRTRLYRARWNDNIVYDLANWLESVVFVESKDLDLIITDLFHDEVSGWPLILSKFEPQFVLDVGDAGIESVAYAISNSRPESVIEDRGLYQRRLLYALWDEAQIGLMNNATNQLTPYRYVEYYTKRWGSAKSHDLTMAIPIRTDGTRKPVLVCALDEADVRSVCLEVFGVSYDAYVRWLRVLISDARHISYTRDLPPILASEWRLHRFRQYLTDTLRDLLFEYRIVRDQTTPKGDRLASILIEDGTRLTEHLNRLGYKPKLRRSLTMRARGGNWQQTDSTYYHVQQKRYGKVLVKVVLAADAVMPKQGDIRFIDKGSEAILNSEETLFRYLKGSGSKPLEYGAEIPVRKAWAWLEPMIGSDGLTGLSDDGLWRGEVCEVSRAEDEKGTDHAGPILNNILNRKGGDPYWHIITGAAGTGKTSVTASLVFRYLESKRAERQYPPRRVLVISYSHFGVDNFDNAFQKVSGGRRTPYRFITPARVISLKEAGVLDEKVLNRSKAYYERLRSKLPKPTVDSQEGISFNAYCAKLKTAIAKTELALSRPAESDVACALISSHERWRSWYAKNRSWRSASELVTTLDNLRTKLERLETYAQTERNERGETAGAGTSNFELYEIFAAEIIESTVDAFDRLPDMFFDLVVFEEASQIGALKLLKIMTKIARVRGDKGPPDLVLSGDPRQLPPFLAASYLDNIYYSPDSGLIETIDPEVEDEVRAFPKQEPLFSRICKRHERRTSILKTQRRMHTEIATLVNSLFYSDQRWETTHHDEGEGVAWYNTFRLGPEVSPESDGTSCFNKIEGGVVRALIEDLLKQGEERILVVSPYLAQVTMLGAEFGSNDRIRVRTIDGCQGIEEDTVIISFVTFRFTEERDFVVDPRRMNVALSRARNSLYLVGNFDEAVSCISKLKAPAQFRHVIGLTDLFQAGARFGHKLHEADILPGLKNDSTR